MLQMTKEIKEIDPKEENWKIQNLPLARVKKIMKAEEFVIQELEKDRLRAEDKSEEEASKHKLMIAADAPILLSRACELLVRELTCRAWQHTERNRRRTLQRQDIHAAVGESEVYDFLIDIVPRVTPAARGQQQPLQHDPSYVQTVGGVASTADPAMELRTQGNAAEALQRFMIAQQQPQAFTSLVEGTVTTSEQPQVPQQIEEAVWDENLNSL